MINARTPLRFKERNVTTHKSHRRQTFWQIAFPLATGVIIALVFTVLAGLAGTESASRWADVSMVFLLIPVMVFSLLFLAFTVGMIYGIVRLSRVIPPYAWRAQELISRFNERVRSGSDRAVEPVFRVHSLLAALRALRGKVG